MTWWKRLLYRLTHAGQWATPEWNLDPEPNMGLPWPETEQKITLSPLNNDQKEYLRSVERTIGTYDPDAPFVSNKEKTP